MRRILFAVFLVVACATGAAADYSYADAAVAYQQGNYALAAILFRPLAENGDARAQVYMGTMYIQRDGVPKNTQEGLKWYHKAAGQGYARAQFNLGNLYDTGHGVPQDYVRAHMWFHVAAAALGDDEGEKALKNRDRVTLRMTAAQIEKAQEMARRCQDTKFKECD